MTQLPPPGWYQDPEGPHGSTRWWDGRRWTRHRRSPRGLPAPGAQAPTHPASGTPGSAAGEPTWFRRHKVLSGVVAAAVALLVIGLALGEEPEPGSGSSGSGSVVADDTDAAGEQNELRKPTTPASGTPRSTAEAGSPPARDDPVPKPPATFLVTRVVDGDTLELGNGETVRLIGIDTPEQGECGYLAATDNLRRIVLGKRVRLGLSEENRDQYGRLLRYVNVGATDAGLRLIRNGKAIARYDSRDGYGNHPREPAYIAADRAAPNLSCPTPAPKPRPPVAGGRGDCAAGYDPCVRPPPPDLDCPDVNGPIRVTGDDPHRLDADGDGIACEWS